MDEKVTKIMNNGDNVDLVFFDFSKAFDSVNHRLSIQKLEAYGIKNNIVNWMVSFLYEKTVNRIPQGSVLGLILSLVYVNDLPDLLQGDVLLSVQDVK